MRTPRCLLVFLAVPLFLLPTSADTTKPGKSVSAVLKPFVDSHSLAGAVVLVADKDKILALEAVGYADVADKVPLKTDALFWIASQSKPITAAALMILVDEGKVKLDDPIEKYLPEFKDLKISVKTDKGTTLEKPKTIVTVRHILSHTSGMPFASAVEKPTLDGLPLRVAVASYAKTPLLFEPGTKYQYSNAGINTAGRIIEVVSGMAYEAFLAKRLFAPLGMKDTTFWPNEEQLKRLAKGYKPNKSKKGLVETKITQLTYPLNDRKRGPMPAGGLFSTATDVSLFCQMMLNEGKVKDKQILSVKAVKELTSKQTGKLKDGYGLGFATGGGAYGHGGAWSTNMIVNTKNGLILVWMVQHAGFPGDGGKAQGAFRKAAEEQFGKAKK